MFDLFTPLHISDFGTLAIDYAHDASVVAVGPNDPLRPQRFDVIGPTAPPRIGIDVDVYVSTPNLPPRPPQLSTDIDVYVSSPTLPNPPQTK